MAHLRKQIRDAFAAALDASLPNTYDVFSSRKFARNIVPGRALVDMRFLNDQTQAIETMSDDRVHIASLYIRVQRPDAETGIDDALDNDEIAIVSAIEAADWSDLLEQDPELLQANFSDNADGGQVIGTIVMRFDCEYRINKSDPETRID